MSLKGRKMETTRVVPQISEEAQYRAREQFARETEAERQMQEIREKKSPYKNWYQLNRDTTLVLMQVAKKSPYTMQVWNFFTAYMDNYNAIMVSYKAMQEILDISRATISRAIKLLEEAGLIYTYKSGNANVYILSPKAIWKRWGKDVKYCAFPVNVVLTLSEQDKEKARIIQEKLNKVSIDDEKEE